MLQHIWFAITSVNKCSYIVMIYGAEAELLSAHPGGRMTAHRPLTRHTVYTTHCIHHTPYTPYTVYTTHCIHHTPYTPHTVYTTHCIHHTPYTPHTVYTIHRIHQTPYTPDTVAGVSISFLLLYFRISETLDIRDRLP